MSAPGITSTSAARLRSLANLARSPADSWLAARMVGWITVLPLLKRTLPLPQLVQLMWLAPRGSDRHRERERRTTRVVAQLSRASGGNCLERSLILYRYLARAGARPRLVVGMAKPDQYLGHVWVTVDDHPLLETSETLREYREITAFGEQGQKVT